MPKIARKGNIGFTMIELVTVLAILAISTAITYSGWVRYKIQSAARFAATQFVDDLRYAREQALIRSTIVRVDWNDFGYAVAVAGPTVSSTVVATLKTGELREQYGPKLMMSPASGRVSFDGRGIREDDSDSNGVPWTTTDSVNFGTEATPNLRLVEIFPTGFSRVRMMED